VTPDADGYPQVGDDAAEITLTGGKALVRSLGILGTCITEAPEFLTKRVRQARGGDRRQAL
jgi:selenophosphate synthetase-related protein